MRLRTRTDRGRPGLVRRAVAVATTVLIASTALVSGASAVQSTVPGAPNPALPDRCELDLAISLDLSNSVTDSQLTQMKRAIGDMADALVDYPVRLAVHNFASNAPATSGNGSLGLTALRDGGADTVAGHVNGLARPQSAQGGTNWDRALAAVAGSTESYDGLIFVTDGNPTQYGSPAAGPGSSVSTETITRAVQSANLVKDEGTRVIAMGVADNINDADKAQFVEHVSQISGTVEGSDYHLADFASLSRTIVDIVDGSCSSIDLEKTATLSTDAESVDYSFLLTNTGGVALTDVSLTDELEGVSEVTFGEWPSAPGVLAPGQSVTATASYDVDVDDVRAGGVSNTATVTGTTPAGNTVVDTDTADVRLTPSIGLVKDAALEDGATGAVGDTVTYSLTATNTGTVTLTGVAITDELDGLYDFAYGTWPGEAGTLTPGQSVTATARYTLTQADVDAGRVDNTATVTGNPPAGASVSDDDDATIATTAGAAGIELVKTGALAEGALGAAGDTVTYTFTATNTGNITLTGITIADPMPGLADLTYDWSTARAEGVLAPNQSVTATATYVLTQADVDAGTVDNTATASGHPPTGGPVSDEDDATVTVPGTPAIAVAKAGVLPDDAKGVAGDVVTYTIVATNTGTVTLDDVTVVDELEGLSELTYVWPGATGVLAPGQSVTATATYALSQDDVDAGKVENTATAIGTPPVGDPVDDEDPVTVTVPGNPGIVVEKDGALPTDGQHRAGDTVTYSFTATNDGNVTLTGVEIVDAKVGVSALGYTWPGAAGVLAPGQSVTATATYVLTQADVDAGKVHNSATAVGTPPTGDPVQDEHPHDVTVRQVPAITVVKDGTLDGGKAGDSVTYSFTATNTGNVTLSAVGIADAKEGLSDLAYGEWPGAAGTLAPGESVSATASYDLTQADVDAGRVDNTATAVGTSPKGVDVDDEDHHAVVVEREPAITLVKDGVLEEGAQGAPGDTVTYTLTATNTGNVTLDDVTVTDAKEGLYGFAYGEWPGAEGVLAPGESVTATASYDLTQADVDAARVDNTATVVGAAPTHERVTDEDPATVPVPQAPGITVVKVGELPEGAEGVPGEVVGYTLTATNTGNLTLTGVEVVDAKEGLSELAYGEWPGEAGVLAPGESVSASASYTLTQADVDAGRVDNTATAVGTPPSGEDVTDEDRHEVVVPGNPGIALHKDGALEAGAQGAPGELVTYSFTATNTGNVTLSGVTVADAKEGLSELAYGEWPAEAGVLAPGESVTATATYPLTQADVDAGTVVNTATATGTTPSGEDVSDEDPATVPVPQLADITVVKEGSLGDEPHAAGDTVTYTITATNTGNVTLSGVEIVDEKEGLYGFSYGEWPGEAGVLAPGQSVTATVRYDLTEADVEALEVRNTATAVGTPPAGPEVGDEDEAVVEIERSEVSAPTVPQAALPSTGAAGAPWLALAALLLLGGAALRTRVRSS
ncbi:VWA domain-containing protein [Georgenia satyanarayanai]|uniref:DUF7507 domain-containing protein n=1 Tax=Georgenia satyanarayanai TaxID=860221 RepID=UPI00203AD65B|nr:VWA domain-containing protein [Georgenia satyanarayanai]MCM3661127.1 VWA domain-containing protein [Georgenia satyanarayanai]